MTRFNEAPEPLSKTFGYNLSILLPSAHEYKRERFIQNLKDTVSDFDSIELVICLDGDKPNYREKNIVTTYSPPSKYRGTFFNAAWKASTGRFMLMANDDILFKTKNWDTLIPFDAYPDELVLFYFRDNQFNEHFSCHPIWSRKVMQMDKESLFKPLYQITKCDNTIWDVIPPHRRIYIPEIVIEHIQTPYGPEWIKAYEEDNETYLNNTAQRNRVRGKILKELNIDNVKVMIGIPTAEYGRRADFHDYKDLLDKPLNSLNFSIHGQSIAFNRNKVAEAAIKNGCTHVFFLDDDVICRSNIIFNLLEHDKDIVTGLQLRRSFPHLPLISNGKQIQLHELNSRLVRIHSAGLGCVLIKTSVFKQMEYPWFRLGEFEPDQMNEDTGFYKRAREVGIDIFCDTRSTVGHIASAVVRPVKAGDNWAVDYDTNGKGTVAFIPQKYENPDGVN